MVHLAILLMLLADFYDWIQERDVTVYISGASFGVIVVQLGALVVYKQKPTWYAFYSTLYFCFMAAGFAVYIDTSPYVSLVIGIVAGPLAVALQTYANNGKLAKAILRMLTKAAAIIEPEPEATVEVKKDDGV